MRPHAPPSRSSARRVRSRRSYSSALTGRVVLVAPQAARPSCRALASSCTVRCRCTPRELRDRVHRARATPSRSFPTSRSRSFALRFHGGGRPGHPPRRTSARAPAPIFQTQLRRLQRRAPAGAGHRAGQGLRLRPRASASDRAQSEPVASAPHMADADGHQAPRGHSRRDRRARASGAASSSRRRRSTAASAPPTTTATTASCCATTSRTSGGGRWSASATTSWRSTRRSSSTRGSGRPPATSRASPIRWSTAAPAGFASGPTSSRTRSAAASPRSTRASSPSATSPRRASST